VVWGVGTLAVALLAAVLIIVDGVAALPVAALVAALFGAAPAWWRWAGERAEASKDAVTADAPRVPAISPPRKAPAPRASRSHGERRLGSPEFRQLIRELAKEMPHEEDNTALAHRTMTRPHLVRHARSAPVQWQWILAQAFDDDDDVSVLDEVRACSRNAQLHAAIDAWLGDQ
jgi:hypothetical protein